MKVFISYSSRDEKILNSFEKYILKGGLKIKSEEIKCTGIENSKPIAGDNFITWIKDNLKSSDIVILLISENYKESDICLNEMGAAWILDKKVIPLLIKPVDYKNVGLIFKTTQLLRIDEKKDLLSLKPYFETFTGDRNIKINNLKDQIEKFLNEINTPLPYKDNKETDFSFFEKFLIKDADYRGLLLKAQPNLSDCKVIFNNTFFKDVYDYYNIAYRLLLDSQDLDDFSEFDTFDCYSSTFEEIIGKKHDLPGGMESLTNYNAIKSNTRFYSITFRKENKDSGTRFSVWVFINNRWIFFIKPWRIIELLVEADQNKGLKRLIGIFRFLKIFNGLNTFEFHYFMNRIKK